MNRFLISFVIMIIGAESADEEIVVIGAGIEMKRAVVIGAGNIGRGFIGKVFSESGYEVCFLDVNKEIIKELCDRKSYTVRTVSNDEDYCTTVKNVYGVDANSDLAIKEIATCDIMATSVGVNVLPKIVPILAAGIKLRIKNEGSPLNILLAENQIHVDEYMRQLIYCELHEKERKWADEHLGLVEVSIGRMIPPLTAEEKKNDPLLIAVEPYCELPADRLGFKGDIPNLKGLIPFTPFDFYIKRKLYLHNMGHAICAYLGFQKRCSYIYEAIADPHIFNVVSDAMEQSAKALHKEFPEIPFEEIDENRIDLLSRFKNKALKDTIFRVANDPIRKLRHDDRLIGSALYCLSQGVKPRSVVIGIIYAYKYKKINDPSSLEIQEFIKNHGFEKALLKYSGIDIDSELGEMILSMWRATLEIFEQIKQRF